MNKSHFELLAYFKHLAPTTPLKATDFDVKICLVNRITPINENVASHPKAYLKQGRASEQIFKIGSVWKGTTLSAYLEKTGRDIN